jgi:hypothetical protein
MAGTDPHVLIQGPSWGDARFYGEWLMAAGKAHAYWREAYTDQDFKKRIDHICSAYIPDFGIAATIFLMKLRDYRTIFLIELNGEDGGDFAMMAEMGFFTQKNTVYQMTLPHSLTPKKVKTSISKFAATEDAEFILHPEYLVTPMTLAEATTLQNRLRAVSDFRNDTDCQGRA